VILATVVDWEALADVIVASLIAVIGVTIMFSLAIYGATRFAEVRRDGYTAGALGYAALAAAGLAVTGAAVAVGLYVMLSK
jgi:hypothetical protein